MFRNVTLQHPSAYSALELSAGAHIPVRCSAKVVIASEDDIYSADTEWL